MLRKTNNICRVCNKTDSVFNKRLVTIAQFTQQNYSANNAYLCYKQYHFCKI